MTLVDVIVGMAIMLLVFLSIFGSFKIAIDLVYSTKAKAGAVALVADRLEYIRSLPYDSVGTVGGIPPGPLAQVATSTVNGLSYTISTLVQYVDDPADGTGNADGNGITADYKLVRVEANWIVRGSARSTYAVTTISPVGLETLASGGTLTINVLNASAAPVADARVTITNASTSPAINVSAETNDAGSVSFPGAPTAGGYHVVVTRTGYSTAQTYTASGANPNPSPADVAVINHKTSTLSLAIDQLSTLHVYDYSPPSTASYADTFADQSKLAATSSAVVSAGSLVLSGGAGSYAAIGAATSTSIAPGFLSQWGMFMATTSAPVGTTLKFRIYSIANDVYTPIPDAFLPGNSAGFASTSVSLVGIPTATYPALALEASLATLSATDTPALADWSLSYALGPVPLAYVPMTIRGSKTIGTTATSAPIYKYTGSFSTGAAGDALIDPIEWDAYLVAPSGSTYDIMERCPDSISVAPATTVNVSFTLVPHTTNSLKVYVSAAGTALPGATVAIGKSGTPTTTQTTSACGQAFFGGISSGTYSLMVSKSGYQTSYTSPVISGTVETSVPLSP